jgi:hypothetical protein
MDDLQAGKNPQMVFQSATEAFLGDSETPIPVRVGQLDEGVPTLSREEFKRASLRQRQLDAEAERHAKNQKLADQDLADHLVEKVAASPPKAPAVARPSGKPLRARRTTSPPAPSAEDGIAPAIDKIYETQTAFEARITRMEDGQAQLAKGVDKLVELLAARDAAVETREEESSSALAETKNFDCELTDKEIALADASVPDDDDDDLAGDGVDEVLPPDPFEPGDPNLARMQAFIQRKTPLKDFRRFWQGLCPRAAFQEWPIEMQDRFTELFRTIILHPKFLAQVRRTVLTFHNGNCMGEEQQYKALVMLAGSCALYSIITAEV